MASAGAAARSRLWARGALAGLVASVVLVANIVSFAALMFPGVLAAGASSAIWAMLIGSGSGSGSGSGVVGVWVN